MKMGFMCSGCDREGAECYDCDVYKNDNAEFYNDESQKLTIDAYQEAYANGQEAGYNKGFKKGREAGYYEGYKKACEVCKRERTSPMCIYAEPDGTWCAIYDTECDGYCLGCPTAKTREGN